MASWFSRFYVWYFGRYPTWSVEAYEAAVRANGYAAQPRSRGRKSSSRSAYYEVLDAFPCNTD